MMLKLLSKLLCHIEDLDLVILVPVVLIIVVLALRISTVIFPTPPEDNPAFQDWSSKSVTGWSNLQPKKMATYRNIEEQAYVEGRKRSGIE